MLLMGIGFPFAWSHHRVATSIAAGLESRLPISHSSAGHSMEAPFQYSNSIADVLSHLQMGCLNSFPQT
jgi:hypothetical protein